MEKIIKDIKEQITQCKELNEPMDEASWNYQHGILLTVNDAISICNRLEKLVMPMFAEVIKNFGEDCPYCDNSGQIIHGYSGDSLADLEMCEFCYTTPKSKFNLYNEIEKVLNASKHSA